MSKRLEDFIESNRDAFDDKMPQAKNWDNIEKALGCKENKRFSSQKRSGGGFQTGLFTPVIKWSMAAAAVLVISISVYWMVNRKNDTVELAGNTVPVDTSINIVTPEVNQFAQMIAMKQEELKVLAKEQPELYQRFTKDIDQLDSSYNTLKKQLSATPNREMLIEAMIQNLQLQLNVLNQQLSIINQIKQKNYSYEKIEQAI